MIITHGLSLEAIEEAVIKERMRFHGDNRNQTASSLGISERTLYTKLEKYDADARDRELAEQRRAEDSQRELERHRKGFYSTGQGVRVESTAQTTAQLEVPMPERAKVQEVLQGQVAQGNKRRARQTV